MFSGTFASLKTDHKSNNASLLPVYVNVCTVATHTSQNMKL